MNRADIHPHDDVSTHVGEGREIGTESLRDGFRTPAPPYESLKLEIRQEPGMLYKLLQPEYRRALAFELVWGRPPVATLTDTERRLVGLFEQLARDLEPKADMRPLSVVAWVEERYENTLRLAGTKTGSEREGWLEDASYYRSILEAVKNP